MAINQALIECFHSYDFDDFVHDYAEFQIGDEVKFHFLEDLTLYAFIDSVCFDEKHARFEYNITTDDGRKFKFVEAYSLEAL